MFCPLVTEKIFLRFFNIYGRGGHLGHAIKIPRAIFHREYPWRLHTQIALIGQVVLRRFSKL